MLPIQDLASESRSYLAGLQLCSVVDNNDPAERGRIRVTLSNILDYSNSKVISESIINGVITQNSVISGDISLLPWIAPLQESFQGGSGTSSALNIPLIGSTIGVIFKNNSPYQGYYIGADQALSIDPRLLENYPNTYGKVDNTGLCYRYNTITKMLKLEHPSGVIFSVDGTGNVTVSNAQSLTQDCVNFIVNATGNIELNGVNITNTATTQISNIAPLITGAS